MRETLNIYKLDEGLQRLENRVRESPLLSANNKVAILDFYNYGYAAGLGQARLMKYLGTLYRLSLMLKKDFRDATKPDIIQLAAEIEKAPFSDWTKHDYKVVIKRFYRWLRQSEEYPEEVRWIKTTVKNENSLLPEELMTPEDLQQMIAAAEHPRDKALIAILYDSGCRIGEILNLRIKHIQPDTYGARIIVSGKTGMRPVRLLLSPPYLLSWINLHPMKDDPEAPVWIELRKKKSLRPHMTYASAYTRLRRLAKSVGVKKRLHPHLYRHSRATFLAPHLKEAQMKVHFGWKPGSKMPGVYVHLSGRDVDEPLLRLAGLKKDEEVTDKASMGPKMCPRCATANSLDSKYCPKCSMVLDVKEAIELDEKRQAAVPVVDALRLMLSDPSVQRTLEQNAQLRSRIEGLLGK